MGKEMCLFLHIKLWIEIEKWSAMGQINIYSIVLVIWLSWHNKTSEISSMYKIHQSMIKKINKNTLINPYLTSKT